MSGYRYLIDLVREDTDARGGAIGLAFACAEVAYAYAGVTLPDFQPSPMRVAGDPASLAGERDQWPDCEVMALFESGSVTVADLRRLFAVCSRYARILPE